MQQKNHRIRFIYSIKMILIIFFVIISFLVPSALAAASPEITRYSVISKANSPEDEFIFLATYKSPENNPPEYVRLVLDENNYNLEPEDVSDLDYSNGKDYIYRTKLSEGVHLYRFEVSDGNKNYSTLSDSVVVQTPWYNLERPEYTHLDVAYSVMAATFIILIPLAYGLYQIKKISKYLGKLANKGTEKEIENTKK